MFEGLQPDKMPQAIEAMLFVTDEPVSAVSLASMLETDVSAVEQALLDLQDRLASQESGILLEEVAGGWRLHTHPAYHELLEAYVLSWDTRKLSAAALEVLAIIAYTQPTTRANLSSVRGVTSDGPLNTLIERGYIREVGTADSPGNPTLYGTTRTFLERYGLRSLKDLPPLEDFAPDDKAALLIRERLGAPSEPIVVTDDQAEEAREAQNLIAELAADVAGVVEKIDFDELSFDTDDE